MLDVKVDKKKSYFSFNVTFFIPEIEISNSVQVFLVLISFPYYFYVQKSNGSIGSVGSAGSKGSTSSTGSEV